MVDTSGPRTPAADRWQLAAHVLGDFSYRGKGTAVHDDEDHMQALVAKLVSAPLYAEIQVPAEIEEVLERLSTLHHNFDTFCPGCERHATYRFVPEKNPSHAQRAALLASAVSLEPSIRLPVQDIRWAMNQFAHLQALCTRNAAHIARYWFALRVRKRKGSSQAAGSDQFDEYLVKIGQVPSLTDFQLGDVGEFDQAMSKGQRREFVQAINSAAHGYAVAACTYLRRVFEQLLVEARDAHMAEHSMADWPAFRSAKTDERIRLLKDRLPEFLVDHPQLYGLLSLGVHELTEEECAREFPLLRQAIELIFTDKAEAQRKAKQREAARKLIDQAGDRYKAR